MLTEKILCHATENMKIHITVEEYQTKTKHKVIT